MLTTSMHLNLVDTLSTEIMGSALARGLPESADGAVLYLRGELGAGKTTCVRSLLRALGVRGTVRSPTYTLVDTYEICGLMCAHVDLYRLQSASEVDELGLRDLTGPGRLLMIEWPENGASFLPAADLHLTLTHAGEARTAALLADTHLGVQWLSEVGRDNSLIPYVSNLT